MKYKAEEPKRSSSGLGIRNSGFIPNPELQATGYCFFPMGPGIDFPLIMNYTDTNAGYGEPYFYFLNGHGDVTYFADANFTPEKIETYEYSAFGFIFGSIFKNNFTFRSLYFDNDGVLYQLKDEIYLSEIGYFLKVNKVVSYLNKKFFKEIYFNKFFNYGNGMVMSPIGSSKACVLGIGCPGGGGVLLACVAGPGCICYCDYGKDCFYTFKECPFIMYITIKCCNY